MGEQEAAELDTGANGAAFEESKRALRSTKKRKLNWEIKQRGEEKNLFCRVG